MSSIKHHVQFVRLGFGDLFGLSGRSLYFTTDELDTKSAQEVVKAIREYGSFRGDKVTWAIGKLAKVWKSKDQQISFRFGRDYFPVLYIKFPFFTTRAHQLRIIKSKEILGETDPAEVIIDDRTSSMRVWWRTFMLP